MPSCEENKYIISVCFKGQIICSAMFELLKALVWFVFRQIRQLHVKSDVNTLPNFMKMYFAHTVSISGWLILLHLYLLTYLLLPVSNLVGKGEAWGIRCIIMRR